MHNPIRVVFVCLGNICRSPLAEVIVRHQANQQNIGHCFHFESAGTGDWHIGRSADTRSAATAQRHGLDLSQHKAQQITTNNIHQWDWFIAMDHENRLNLLAMGASSERIIMMRQFERKSVADDILNVPDPYYGGEHGFEDVYVMLEENANAIIEYISCAERNL